MVRYDIFRQLPNMIQNKYTRKVNSQPKNRELTPRSEKLHVWLYGNEFRRWHRGKDTTTKVLP